MTNRFFFIPLAGLVSLLLLVSCSTMKMTASWKDPHYNERPLKNVLIVAVFDNQERRAMIEEAFVGSFDAASVAASASSSVISKMALTRGKVKMEAEKHKNDAVFTIRMVGYGMKDQERRAGITSGMAPVEYGEYPFPGDETLPSYVLQKKYVKLETSLYSTASGKLIWTAAFEEIDPESVTDVVHDLSQAVMDSLREQKLIH